MDLRLGGWIWVLPVLLASCITLGKVTVPYAVPTHRGHLVSICWLLNKLSDTQLPWLSNKNGNCCFTEAVRESTDGVRQALISENNLEIPGWPWTSSINSVYEKQHFVLFFHHWSSTAVVSDITFEVSSTQIRVEMTAPIIHWRLIMVAF